MSDRLPVPPSRLLWGTDGVPNPSTIADAKVFIEKVGQSDGDAVLLARFVEGASSGKTHDQVEESIGQELAHCGKCKRDMRREVKRADLECPACHLKDFTHYCVECATRNTQQACFLCRD